MTRRGSWGWMLLLTGCFSDPPPVTSTTGSSTSVGMTASGSEGTGSEGTGSEGTTSATTDATTTGPADSTTGSTACPTMHTAPDGSCARWVFVTSESFLGDLGGRAGADALCQAEATAPGSEVADATFRAFLRVDGEPVGAAWDMIGVDDLPDASFVMPGPEDGSLVATSPMLLHTEDDPSAALINAIQRDATGVEVDGSDTTCAANSVWTGLSRDIEVGVNVTGNACNSWSSSAGSGQVGSMVDTDERWAGRSANCMCSMPAHLYCFEIVEP